MSCQVVPVEGDLVRVRRESIQRNNESLLFRRGKTWNVDDVTGGCITLFRESRFDHKRHRRGHFFNYRLKRMHGNGGREASPSVEGVRSKENIEW
jgi:hypothetical protein